MSRLSSFVALSALVLVSWFAMPADSQIVLSPAPAAAGGLASADINTAAELDAIATDYVALRKATVTLTDVQIKALPSTPVEIVSALGAAKITQFLQSVLILDTTGGAYTNVDAAYAELGAKFGGTFVSSRIISDGTINDVAIFLDVSPPIKRTTLLPAHKPHESYGIIMPPNNASIRLNTALTLAIDNGAGDFTGGHASNYLKVVTYYTVIDVP